VNGADTKKANDLAKGETENPYPLVIIFLTLSFIVILAGYTYYRFYKEALINNAKKELIAICDLKVDQLVQWRKERLGDAKYIFNNILLSTEIIHFLKDPGNRPQRAKIQSWLNLTRDAYDYKEVAVFDLNGKVIFSTETNIHQEESHTRLAQTSLEKREVTIEDLHKQQTTGEVDLGLFIPVLISKGKEEQAMGGIMLLSAPKDFLYPLIQSWPVPSETAETLLLKQDGNDVLYLNELRHKRNTALTLRMPIEEGNLPAAMAVRGRQGIVEGRDYRNVPVIAAIRKVPSTGWYFISKIDLEEVYLPAKRIVFGIVIFVIVGVLSAALGIGLFWHNRMAAYYRRLYKAEEAQRQSDTKFRLFVERAPLALGVIGKDGAISYINDRFTEIFGYTRQDIPTTKEWRHLAYPDEDYRQRVVKIWKEAIAHATYTVGDIKPIEYNVTCKNGEVRVIEIAGVVFPDSSLLVTFIDITGRKKAEEELRALSIIDELTGLNNRRGFLIMAKQHIKLADRLKKNVALIYADIDNMKKINDTLGHKEGDQALIDMANVLKGCIRASDIVARWGGDEFVGLILETSKGGGDIVCANLQEKINAHNIEGTRPFKLSISFGLTRYDTENPCTLQELLERGDRLMYEQKRKKQPR
jgi:diguanylate cyclase (GGDEF)-like protein/PAS domain S-box-containing protein